MNIYELIEQSLSPDGSAALIRDLDAMERELRDICDGAGILADGLTRVNNSGGKRLRPLLARVCWTFGPGAGRAIVPLMMMLELMHTTSLIHDDIVDNASRRRGVETINHREGCSQAVRSGDYLLARAMERLKQYRGTGINEYLSFVAQEMCLGELDQNKDLFRARGMTEERYFARIRRKTALLMAAACRCGAVAGGSDETTAAALTEYGMALGVSFQLRDDILDWQASALTGKAPMRDLWSGVITLPGIYAMQRHPDIARTLEAPGGNHADVSAASAFVEEAMPQALHTLKAFGNEAVRAIDPLPACEGKRALQLLAIMISEVSETCQN